MWKLQLVTLYCTVCNRHSIMESVTQRQSNNSRPKFSDEECMTVYLWGIMKRRFELKAIYNYTREHLREWFLKLPSYQMNQAIFKKIWIHENGTVTTEFTDIYKNIVGPTENDIVSQNTKSAPAEADADSIHKLLKSYSVFWQGLNNKLLVEATKHEANIIFTPVGLLLIVPAPCIGNYI